VDGDVDLGGADRVLSAVAEALVPQRDIGGVLQLEATHQGGGVRHRPVDLTAVERPGGQRRPAQRVEAIDRGGHELETRRPGQVHHARELRDGQPIQVAPVPLHGVVDAPARDLDGIERVLGMGRLALVQRAHVQPRRRDEQRGEHGQAEPRRDGDSGRGHRARDPAQLEARLEPGE